jgi:predicted nucleotidyltransferase
MTSSLTIAQFRSQFGTTPDRLRLLSEFEGFLTQLRSNFTQYRVLVYGSFISQKQVPRDIDVIVSVSSSPTDPGFNKFSKLQALATQCVDVFTLNLKSSFDAVDPVPDAESMIVAYNTREAHTAKGIHCKAAIEIV